MNRQKEWYHAKNRMEQYMKENPEAKEVIPLVYTLMELRDMATDINKSVKSFKQKLETYSHFIDEIVLSDSDKLMDNTSLICRGLDVQINKLPKDK